MSNIQTHLTELVNGFERVGHPAVMERFILRNGKLRHGAPYKGKMGKPKNCFHNATHLMMDDTKLKYEEGYVMIPGIPLANHHAWCVDPKGIVLEPTIPNAERYTYMGVHIEEKELWKQLATNEVYGVLDTGRGVNTSFVFKHDPELKKIVDEVIKKSPNFRM